MSFQMEISSLGETVFFQVGFCTPLETMEEICGQIFSQCELLWLIKKPVNCIVRVPLVRKN